MVKRFPELDVAELVQSHLYGLRNVGKGVEIYQLSAVLRLGEVQPCTLFCG